MQKSLVGAKDGGKAILHWNQEYSKQVNADRHVEFTGRSPNYLNSKYLTQRYEISDFDSFISKKSRSSAITLGEAS